MTNGISRSDLPRLASRPPLGTGRQRREGSLRGQKRGRDTRAALIDETTTPASTSPGSGTAPVARSAIPTVAAVRYHEREPSAAQCPRITPTSGIGLHHTGSDRSPVLSSGGQDDHGNAQTEGRFGADANKPARAPRASSTSCRDLTQRPSVPSDGSDSPNRVLKNGESIDAACHSQQ